jgi:hypothetical protein
VVTLNPRRRLTTKHLHELEREATDVLRYLDLPQRPMQVA